MEKYGLTILLFIVIFTTGYFGQRLGYTVDGVPHGGEEIESTQTKKIGDIPFFDYEPTIEVEENDSWTQVFEYLWDFASFKIDGIPDWMAGLCDIFVLLVLVLIFNMIRGNA